MDAPACPAHPKAALLPAITGAQDRFWGYEGAFDYQACETCGAWVLSPRPSPSELGEFYGSYYTDEQLERFRARFKRRRPEVAGIISRLRAIGFLRRFRKIGGRLDRDAQLLDVGCGLGGFARFVRDLTGAESRGLDFNPKCRDFAAEVHRLPIDTGELRDQKYADEQFDVVTAWHVMEHVYDPIDELTEMARILKPGGWMMIEVPTNDIVGKLFRGRWVYLQPPTHLYHYRPETLRLMLEQVGLQVVSVRRPWFPGEIAASVIQALGVHGFIPKVFGPGRPLSQKLLTVFLFAQMIYDVPLSLFLSAIGRPGLLRVFARKPD